MNYNTIISERQDRGEVITPISLVEEMLNKLPKEVFESKTTTFLDPCFGTGTFLKAIGLRLKAYGHSTENINSRLFGFEVDSRMFNETKRKFQGINIIKQDFLNTDINMKFDVVIGNPPFQAPGNFKGSTLLWPAFYEKADSILKENGYLFFLSPYTWASAINEDSKNSKVSLCNFNTSELLNFDLTPNNHFKVGSSTISSALFCKNKKLSTNVNIKFSAGVKLKMDISNLDFIPMHVYSNNDISIFNKVINNDLEKFELLNTTFGRGVRSSKDNLSESPNKDLTYKSYYTWSNYKKNKFLWSSSKGLYHDTAKIVLFYSNDCSFVYDNGSAGLGHLTAAIPCDSIEEYNNAMTIFDSKLFEFVSKFKPYKGTHGGKPAIVKHFPKLSFDKSWTNQEIYEYFNLTQEEIDYVENAIK
jgi:hypothetical protein